MKKLIIMAFLLTLSNTANANEMCDVTVCNKLKRFSLSPWNHVKDAIGTACYDIVLPKELAVSGKELDSSTRWYQGSFNPTKRSVTYIKDIKECK